MRVSEAEAAGRGLNSGDSVSPLPLSFLSPAPGRPPALRRSPSAGAGGGARRGFPSPARRGAAYAHRPAGEGRGGRGGGPRSRAGRAEFPPQAEARDGSSSLSSRAGLAFPAWEWGGKGGLAPVRDGARQGGSFSCRPRALFPGPQLPPGGDIDPGSPAGLGSCGCCPECRRVQFRAAVLQLLGF